MSQLTQPTDHGQLPTNHIVPTNAVSLRKVPEPVAAGGLDFGAEEGIATAEFSIVTLAAVGFAGLLVTILASGDVRELLLGMVRNALGG